MCGGGGGGGDDVGLNVFRYRADILGTGEGGGWVAVGVGGPKIESSHTHLKEKFREDVTLLA